MSNKELMVRQMGNLLVIDGELYEPVFKEHQRDVEVIKFRRISKRRFERLKKEIIAKLSKRLDSESILESALNDMSMCGLERIVKELARKKPRVRKEHGCFDLVVGQGKDMTTIPIR